MQRSQERTWVALAVAAILLLAQTPYLLGALRTPRGFFYAGHPYFNDSTVYLNDMLQGAHHGPLWFHDYATTDVHAPVFTFHFYLALGWLGKLLRLAPWTTFHLARFVFGAALLLAVWRLSRPCFRRGSQRLALLAVLGLSCGVRMSDGQLPISEANTFQSISIFPHFAASILFLVAYYAAFARLCSGRGRVALPLAVCLAAVVATGVTHPWNFATMGAVSAAFLCAMALRGGAAWRARWSVGRVGALAAVALAAAGLGAMQAYVQRTSPLLQVIMGKQNALPVRGLGEWVSFFGWLWLPATAGAVLALRRWRRTPMLFPALWFVANGLVLAIPFGFQRRLVEGMHVPVAVLTTWVALLAARRVGRCAAARRAAFAAAVALVLAAGAPAQVRYLTFTYPDSSDYYEPGPLRDAVEWAGAHLPERSNVLASVATSRVLLRNTLLNVYAGHGVRTPGFDKRTMAVLQFYLFPQAEGATEAFLRGQGIDYVFDGPFERNVVGLSLAAQVVPTHPDGSPYEPHPNWFRSSALRVVYDDGQGVRIFAFGPARGVGPVK